jgi:hypothetical protein
MSERPDDLPELTAKSLRVIRDLLTYESSISFQSDSAHRWVWALLAHAEKSTTVAWGDPGIVEPLAVAWDSPGNRADIVRSLSTLDHDLLHVHNLDDATYDSDDPREVTADLEVANVITSMLTGRTDLQGEPMHSLVLDIDHPATLIPSSTPGHFHLLIDKPMHWSTYEEVLRVLVRARILEVGYVGASIDRKMTDVRLPWIRKPECSGFRDCRAASHIHGCLADVEGPCDEPGEHTPGSPVVFGPF